MRFDLENSKIGHVSLNHYVDFVPNLCSGGKKPVTRTRSEPPYLTNWTKPKLRNGWGYLTTDHDQRIEDIVSNQSSSSVARKLFPVLQDSIQDGKHRSEGVDSRGAREEHCRTQRARPKPACSKEFKPRHRRSTSITETELKRRNSSQENYFVDRLLANSRTEASFICERGAYSNAVFNSAEIEAMTITKQPVSRSTRDNSILSQSSRGDDRSKDKCFRCLNRIKDAVNCCTCITCFDTFCYHCFKDDIGYSSWFHEMVTCSGSTSSNCKRWTLFGLGVILLPCVFFYPLLGGAVNLCIKCRIQKTQYAD